MPIGKADISTLHRNGEGYNVVPTSSLSLLTTAEGALVWLYLLSKPADWVIRKSDIMKNCNLGEDRYRKAIRDMRNCNLMANIRVPREGTNLTTVERWCYAMPMLKPRKSDRQPSKQGKITHSEVKPHCGKTPPIHSIETDTYNRLLELDTNVSNVDQNSSMEKDIKGTIKKVTRTRRKRTINRATTSNDTKRATVSAVWNLAVKEYYPDSPIPLVPSTASCGYMTRQLVNVNLKDGEWKDVLRYSIAEWMYHKTNTFSWMVKSPMPDFPDYMFWQRNFKKFVGAYAARDTVNRSISNVVANPVVDKTKERKLKKQLDEAIRQKKELATAAANAEIREREVRKQLQTKNKSIRRLRKRVKSSANDMSDVETWEERE